MQQILLNGVSLNDLLERIGQIIDAKVTGLPQKHNNQSSYLSRKEVASLLKITLPTLHDYTKQGWIRSYKIGSRVLYKPNEVQEAIEKVQSFKHKRRGYGK